MWAWSRGLQNTVPALASAYHIRQQFIKEKQLSEKIVHISSEHDKHKTSNLLLDLKHCQVLRSVKRVGET